MKTAIEFLVQALLAELPSIKGASAIIAELKSPLLMVRDAINELYPGS